MSQQNYILPWSVRFVFLKKIFFKYVSIYCMKLRRLDKFENNYKRHYYALRSHFKDQHSDLHVQIDIKTNMLLTVMCS